MVKRESSHLSATVEIFKSAYKKKNSNNFENRRRCWKYFSLRIRRDVATAISSKCAHLNVIFNNSNKKCAH